MAIQEKFCPKCGGPTEGGLCSKCKVEMTEWLVCEQRVTFVFCPTCGSIKHGSTWTDVHIEKDELSADLALQSVHIHEDVTDVNIEIDAHDPSPNRTVCNVHVTGSLYGIELAGSCRIEIIWKKEQCDRCNRYSGGYYEGNLQIRATGRKPALYEVKKATEIAYDIEEELQDGGERLSFISRLDETRDGLDIVVGSHHIGDRIAREIVKSLGGKITTHPKLVGEKDGKKLYRITYSVRLPCYQKGDVIVLSGRYYEIREMEHHAMKIFDLKDGTIRIQKEDCSGRLIGNVREAEEALVAYIDAGIAGVLDPVSFRTRECTVYPWLGLTEGSHIRVLHDRENDKLVLVG